MVVSLVGPNSPPWALNGTHYCNGHAHTRPCKISLTKHRIHHNNHHHHHQQQHHHHQHQPLFKSPIQMAAVSNDGVGTAPKEVAPKLLTLVIVEKEGRVLLGFKKRGFGEGYYNGFGGKVEIGETIEEAALRELKEEAGITSKDLVKRGILTFHFDDKPQPWEVHVFHTYGFDGEPYETDEMRPIWFNLADIPYDRMWKDDRYWYPYLFEGKLFRGEFFFENSHELVSHNLQIVESITV